MAERVILAGLPFAAASADELADWIALRRRASGCAAIVSASVDFVVQASRDEELAEDLRQSTILTASAVPIVWLSRLVGRGLPNSVPGHELMEKVAERAARTGSRILLLGPDSYADRAATLLKTRFPMLKIQSGTMPATPAVGMLSEHLQSDTADLLIICSSDACRTAKLICDAAEGLPAGVCVLLTDPRDLENLADSSGKPIAPASLGRTLREFFAFIPVLLHEWLHLIGARHACLPPHPFVSQSDELPPDRLSDPVARHRLKRMILVATDMLVFAGSFLLADRLRCQFWEHQVWPQPTLNSSQQWYWYLWILPVLMAVWPPILASLGLYRTALPPPTWRWQRAVAIGAILLMVFSTLALFFSRLAYPRMQILITSLLAPAAFMLARSALVAAAKMRRWFNDLGLPDYSSY